MIAIRPYQPEHDEAAVLRLWQDTLGSEWPLTHGVFRRAMVGTDVYRDGDHFVAEQQGTLLGFVTTQTVGTGLARSGHLGVLLVAPARRRCGIGRALHDTALAHLRETGASQVQLGGGDTYLWPGVPSTLAPALAFFSSCGWTYGETTYDLVQDLRDYSSPSAVVRRAASQGITLDVGTAAYGREVLAFVAREFPSWEANYGSVVDMGDDADLLFARDGSGRIIGAVTMYSPLSHPQRMDVRWKTLLGADAGAIGVVGVGALERNRGVGHAMVARASEIVRERGTRHCFIGWAWMVGLYGDLGYRVWHVYYMSRRTCAEC